MKVFSLSSIFLVNSPGPTGGQSCFDLLKRFSTKGPKTHDPTPAFAFDIDGVLKRGSEVMSALVDLPRVGALRLASGSFMRTVCSPSGQMIMCESKFVSKHLLQGARSQK